MGRSAATTPLYKWKHSKLEYALYLNPDEIQALYIERNEA